MWERVTVHCINVRRAEIVSLYAREDTECNDIVSAVRNMQSEVYPRSLKRLVPHRQRSELATRPT
jgi:hypothetical protein